MQALALTAVYTSDTAQYHTVACATTAKRRMRDTLPILLKYPRLHSSSPPLRTSVTISTLSEMVGGKQTSRRISSHPPMNPLQICCTVSRICAPPLRIICHSPPDRFSRIQANTRLRLIFNHSRILDRTWHCHRVLPTLGNFHSLCGDRGERGERVTCLCLVYLLYPAAYHLVTMILCTACCC